MVTENMENKKSIKLRRNMACVKFTNMDKKGEYPHKADSRNQERKKVSNQGPAKDDAAKLCPGGSIPAERNEDDSEKHSFPSQKNLEKEISDYLTKKYGGKVKVISQMVIPKQVRPGDSEFTENTPGKKGSASCFDIMPEELEAYLDEYVVKQSAAKAVLATKICTHFKKIAYMEKRGKNRLPVGNIKNNIILIGPTGVGKTYLIKLIAAKLGVPFVKGDATKFSETGYVGGDVEDLVRDLVKEADGDIEKAQYGIIYIDEIDKIASTQDLRGPDVSRAGVQRALLKPLEETDVDLKTPHDPISQLEAIEHFRKTGKRMQKTINTRNILFIVSGAFSGLAEIIRKRLSSQGIGFGAEVDVKEDKEWLRHVKPQDLVEFGFENEFIGRLPVIAVLEELNEDDLFQILRNPKSPVIVSKKQDFRAYGIDLKFEEDALRLLASRAYQEKTGARALVSVIERALMPFEKKLPSSAIDYLVVTRQIIEDPEGELRKLLEEPDMPRRKNHYEAFLSQEKQQIIAGLSLEVLPEWQEQGMALNDLRKELIAHLCLKDDLSLEEAAANVLFWIQQIKSYEASFYNRCEIQITFDDSAVDRILDACRLDPSSLYVHCERLSSILEYGLTLIREKTGQEHFNVPSEAVDNPELFINRLIRICYESEK